MQLSANQRVSACFCNAARRTPRPLGRRRARACKRAESLLGPRSDALASNIPGRVSLSSYIVFSLAVLAFFLRRSYIAFRREDRCVFFPRAEINQKAKRRSAKATAYAVSINAD